MKVLEEMEHEIWWQPKVGNSSFWFDNWTKLGALYFINDSPVINDEGEIQDFIVNGQWARDKLQESLSEELVDYRNGSITSSAEVNNIDRLGGWVKPQVS